MPYSSLLVRFASSSSGLHLIYTAPAGYVTVVRDISVANTSGSSEAYSLYASGNPGPTSAFILINGSLANDAVDQWEGRQVLNAGDTLTLSIGGADFTCLISGYLLSSP